MKKTYFIVKSELKEDASNESIRHLEATAENSNLTNYNSLTKNAAIDAELILKQHLNKDEIAYEIYVSADENKDRFIVNKIFVWLGSKNNTKELVADLAGRFKLADVRVFEYKQTPVELVESNEQKIVQLAANEIQKYFSTYFAFTGITKVDADVETTEGLLGLKITLSGRGTNDLLVNLSKIIEEFCEEYGLPKDEDSWVYLLNKIVDKDN